MSTVNKIMPDFCNRRFPFHFTTAMHILKKLDVDPKTIEILAVGKFENYKGEVRTQKPAPDTPLMPKTKIVIEVGLTSAVDIMPYQFFYGLAGITDRASDWENNARRLMAPFDAAFIRYMAAASYEKMKFNFNFIDDKHLAKYLELYDFSGVDISNPNTAARWQAIMPTFHIWAGNAEKMAMVLKFLFSFDFTIIESTATRHKIPENLQYRLGSKDKRLGYESIAGRSFDECDTGYEVVISGIDKKDVSELLPGKNLREKIEAVLNYCMPGNLDYKISVKVIKEASKLGDKSNKGYLGYNTFVKDKEFY
ncbi:MAG: type VI secretion system baseplate subunit TssG [candidate division Zixibacteria bacterium]|nr:type VI secretion system baseplate subunit TssG [candidate division Zixibacteria bacterium]